MSFHPRRISPSQRMEIGIAKLSRVRLGEIFAVVETLNRSTTGRGWCPWMPSGTTFGKDPSDSLTNEGIRCFHRSREFYINFKQPFVSKL
jgi:hypothetical protein